MTTPSNINLSVFEAILLLFAGIVGPSAGFVIFAKVAVKLALPLIIDALMESAVFLEAIALKLSKNQTVCDRMAEIAVHKTRNLETLWGNQLDMLKMSMDRDRQEERQWRELTSKQIESLTKTVGKLAEAVAWSQGHHSQAGPDSEVTP